MLAHGIALITHTDTAQTQTLHLPCNTPLPSRIYLPPLPNLSQSSHIIPQRQKSDISRTVSDDFGTSSSKEESSKIISDQDSQTQTSTVDIIQMMPMSGADWVQNHSKMSKVHPVQRKQILPVSPTLPMQTAGQHCPIIQSLKRR